jgi:2-polyprenyl-3-methyl-5-hydroxy-6-metoxy-1,4-benzoquinol methylase
MLPQTEAKPNVKAAVRSAMRNVFHPTELLHALKLQRHRKSQAVDRVRRDPQLELYSRILKRGFLHYGYFKDPQTPPETLSFRDIEEAQLDYAKLFTDTLSPSDRDLPILDIGCGMGGLSVLLSDQGYQPVALSPDQHQITYIQEKHPQIPTLHCKFEEIDPVENQKKYGVVITSESLQYLKLDVALPLLDSILKPGGKWLLCDYFRKDERAHEKSGHVFETFKKQVEDHGWVIHQDKDVTPNILVTLRYLQFLADRLVLPLMDFGVGKLQHKQPGWAYLLRDVLGEVKRSTLHGLQTVDPERFAQEKTYRWMELRRK